VHESSHVDFVFESAPERGYAYLDPDTSMNARSLSAALHAAGAVVAATDAVMAGEAKRAFCAVRPPGHHATRDRPMGFCLFNNVAIGAAHAIAAHGLERVAVLDFDVHHGNGTEDAFHDDGRVMLCSTFQHPYYPYSGAESGNAHIINVPLPAMTDGCGFRAAVERTWLPALESYRPQLVFVSAGFDAHRDDPLADVELTDGGFAALTGSVRRLAAELEAPVGAVLEGGYDLRALAASTAAMLRVLTAADPPPAPDVAVAPEARAAAARLVRHWPALAAA
jgi:acetoin utilization deacetylase AcuC-like enzyme